MQDQTQYSTISETQLINDDGSGSTVTNITINAGDQPRLRKRKYSMRYRTDKTNIALIERVLNDLLNDPEKFETGLDLEKTPSGEAKNSFDLVAHYTVIVRE